MANKKSAAKKAEAPKAVAAARPKAPVRKAPIFMIGSIIMAAVFLPSSILLAIGMLPTLAALFAEPAKARTKVVTVGAMNLAGCVPFLLDLWTHGHSIDKALNIVTSPQAIIVMYAAAAIGYLIDWSMSAVVATILYQRGLARQESIKKRQAELSLRWGPEVTGDLALDHHGFAVKNAPGDE